MNYRDKIVLVTGASRGIGKELVKYFLANEATVLGLSKSDFSCDGKYFHYSCDISKGSNIHSTFRKIVKDHGRIDIVINNAAVLTSQYAMIMPIQNAEDMVNTNLLGTFFVSREAVKIMRKFKHGRIINIGSMAASLEPMGDSIYAATKAGVRTLANVMSREFSKLNITCNTLGVTAIETDMLNQLPREKIDEIIEALPVPRYANIDDITNVIDFFASDKSSYITSQTVYLGGIN
ncbi:MAG: SDR family NAD(P)-dependent oxidoreductase [Bacteroidetes bacterium]|nr:SDR family NAD(P)-dependent oxidoreductase [Bacteroidota bacterium]MDA1119606.1 SDR family NAD(P)-dependent oxidoreductase [Bacteroidota bacterium]